MARRERASTTTPTIARPPPPEDRRCALCGQPSHLTFHHLVPRDLHDQRRMRGKGPIEVLRSRGIWICRPCHDFLHRQFDVHTLGERLDSLETLLAEPAVARHVAWASKQRRTI